MEPTPSKRHKAPAVQITDGNDQRVVGEDRISSLPEAVLALILSRLPTKCAISTSVLSTKWRHLFSLIHHPSIEIYDVEQPPPRSTSFINPRFINPSFIHFVSHLFNQILPQFPLIEVIDLTLYENYGKQRIDQWFYTAPPCNVRCLRLYTAGKGNGISSLDVLRPFASVSRIELYFQRCNIYDHHSTLLFPNLTWLSLNGLNFEGYNLLERALAACPNLRRLHLIRCKFDYGEEVICISVPSLRILLLCGCYREELGLIIETPILESLYYNEHVSNIYPMLDSPAFGSLVTAILNIKPSVGTSNFPMLDYTENVAKLMAAFSGVTSLDISVRKIALNDEDNFRMPSFPNLTKLDIGIFDIVGWEILAMFLQSSPLLRVLSVFPRQELRLKLGVSGHMEYYERFQSRLTDTVPLCLSSHLSEFVFQEFEGDKDDCRLVQYFLRAARVLKKMQICFLDSVSQEEALEIKEYILTSPICSTNCHIDIVMQNEDAY